MRNALGFAVAGLLISIHSFAAPAPSPAPSNACQLAAYRAAAGTIPAGAKMTGVYSVVPPVQPQLNQNPTNQDAALPGSVILIGEISEHEFSVHVHVRYLGSPLKCQIYQVDNLDWGDHI